MTTRFPYDAGQNRSAGAETGWSRRSFPDAFWSASMQESDMPLSQCAALAIEQAACRQRRVMAGYSFNLVRGQAEVRDMILKDISRFSDLGARRHVCDLSEVLEQFDLAHPVDLAHLATPAHG